MNPTETTAMASADEPNRLFRGNRASVGDHSLLDPRDTEAKALVGRFEEEVGMPVTASDARVAVRRVHGEASPDAPVLDRRIADPDGAVEVHRGRMAATGVSTPAPNPSASGCSA